MLFSLQVGAGYLQGLDVSSSLGQGRVEGCQGSACSNASATFLALDLQSHMQSLAMWLLCQAWKQW